MDTCNLENENGHGKVMELELEISTISHRILYSVMEFYP